MSKDSNKLEKYKVPLQPYTSIEAGKFNHLGDKQGDFLFIFFVPSIYVNKFYYMQSGILKVLTRSDKCDINHQLEMDSQLHRYNRDDVEAMVMLVLFIYFYLF